MRLAKGLPLNMRPKNLAVFPSLRVCVKCQLGSKLRPTRHKLDNHDTLLSCKRNWVRVFALDHIVRGG